MEVLLLLEADDEVTISAAREYASSDIIHIVLVPPAEPRTKPKACNYGLQFATGDIVTIYDAEDLPEPLQLRRTVAAFAKLPPEVVCIQSKLAYHNSHQNILTGWFTAEYNLWFGYLLPGMMRSSSPIPLGGTSNHLRRDVLEQIGAWDPFNVTEDADLGLRIHALGYRTAVLDSTTLEEANSDPINWIPPAVTLVQGVSPDLARAHPPARADVAPGRTAIISAAHPDPGGDTDHRRPEPALLVHHHPVVPRPAGCRGRGVPLVHLLPCAHRPDPR